MSKSGTSTSKRSFRHIGIGFPSLKILNDTVKALTTCGAVIVRKNEYGSFFLLLNAEDITELELYCGRGGIHFDKSVGELADDLFASKSLNDGTIMEHSKNMFFAPIVSYEEQKMDIEMAFYKESFDWDPWISRIEEAVSKNDVLVIDIDEAECKRLEDEKAASLKAKLSPKAARLIHVFGNPTSNRFKVTVCRVCGACTNAE